MFNKCHYAFLKRCLPKQSLHLRLLFNPIHLIALGFGTGLSPIAPGTIATLLAWGVFKVTSETITMVAIVIWIAGFLLSTAICKYTSISLGELDHRAIVLDEIFAFCLVLYVLIFISPILKYFIHLSNLHIEAIAFLLFRFFDIKKPGLIGMVEKKLKTRGWIGAFGIMLDDIFAAIFTIAILAAISIFAIAFSFLSI